MNEVQKTVTAPEFLVLQQIHGHDSMHRVEEIKNEKVNSAVERRRLKENYDQALKRKKQSVDLIFGALGQLPSRLPDEALVRFNINIDDEITEQEIGRIDAGKGHNPNDRSQPLSEKELMNLETIASADDVRVADLLG